MSVRFAAKNLARAVTVIALASATGACSSVPSWMNPFGDDTPSTSDDAGLPPPPPADQSADNGASPDLADVPDRPTAAAPSDSQRQVADSLAADRSRAKYSADALRGDAAAAAPPPAPPSATDMVADTPAPDTRTADTRSMDTPPAAAPEPQQSTTTDAQTVTAETSSPSDSIDTRPDAIQSSSTTTTTASTDSAPPPPMPSSSRPAVAPAVGQAPAPQVMASTAPSAPAMAPSSGGPAVPAVSGVRTASVPGARVSPTDAQLGFQPSTAPALDASVSQFVSPPILNRYRQTAHGQAFSNNAAAVPATAVASNTRSRRARNNGVGGPEQMSGSVVANLNSLSAVPGASTPSVYANASGLPATSVVFFPGDTTILSAAAKSQVRAAAESFRAGGGSGFIRVVGHASSRTGNMPLERHLVVIFEKSQQRANSVAQELIRDGVPAEKVLVEAVGDSQPVYYESMPKGEDGNRRAEIFVQS